MTSNAKTDKRLISHGEPRILQIGVLLELASPAGIFFNFVRELGRRSTREAEILLPDRPDARGVG